MQLNTLTTTTKFGPFSMVIDANNIVHASGFSTVDELRARLPKAMQEVVCSPLHKHTYIDKVHEYCEGKIDALASIKYHQQGSDFYQRVWSAMQFVSAGTTISYKELAHNSGNPNAVRAAGTACGQNRLILIVPCHRIVKSDGGLGNYLYGSEIKRSLLDHEATYQI